MCSRRWHRSAPLEQAETLRALRDRRAEPAAPGPEDDPAPVTACGPETLPSVKLAVACADDPFFMASATTRVRRIAPFP